MKKKTKLLLIISIVVIIIAIILSSFIFGTTSKDDEVKEKASEEVVAKELIYVKSEKVSKVEFNNIINLPGVSKAFQSIDVLAKISGDVNNVFFNIGEEVKKGEVIVKIDDTQYLLNKNQAKIGLDNAKLSLDIVKRDYEKSILLHKSGAIADNNMNDIEVQYKKAKLSYDNAKYDYDRANLNYNYTEVESPIDGIIGEKNISFGDSVSQGMNLFKVVDIEKVYINVGIPENSIDKVLVGQSVEIETYYGKEKFLGTIENIKPIIDLATHTYEGKIIVENSERKLKDGMSVNVKISSTEPFYELGVNKLSVRIEGEDKYVYVNENGVAKRKKVKLGISNDDYYQILEGIELNEEVITDGSGMLKEGKNISIQN